MRKKVIKNNKIYFKPVHNLRPKKDLGQQPDSLKGLKYILMIWSIIGATPPKATQWRFLYFVYASVMHFFCSFCFSASMVVNLFFIDSFQTFSANLSLGVSICISVIKQLSILTQRNHLLKANEYLRLLDKLSKDFTGDHKDILKAIHHSQLFIIFLPSYIFCGCGFSYNGWSNHQLPYNAWYPHLFSNEEVNYLAVFIFQFISQIFLGFQTVFNDVFSLCYLTLMVGHLESLAARIAGIGWDKKQKHSTEENIDELKSCIVYHKNILRYFHCIRPVISTTLFLQFLTTGLALGLTAINLTFFSPDFKQQFFTFFYLIILLLQVFPTCWYVNVLMEKNDYLRMAIYSCNWMDQNQKFRKMLIIFMQRSQKANIILAGGLTPVTLQTFLSIIRFAFSMYTILSKM